MPSFLHPEPTRPQDSVEGPLDPRQVQQWRKHGALLLSEVFPERLIRRSIADIRAITGKRSTYFGKESELTFPSASDAINRIAVHPRILSLAAQVLGTDEIRLSQAEAWSKKGLEQKEFETRGPKDAWDQRIHCDYPNHTLLHPSAWDTPDAVSFILYLSDFATCGGGTAIVEKTGPDDEAYQGTSLTITPGVRGHWINDRKMAEARYQLKDPKAHEFRKKLYEREVIAHYREGSLLVYRQDLWHRGTPLTPGSTRFVMNITYRRKEAEWIGSWHPGWARFNYSLCWPERRLERLIASLTPKQRTVLGIPPPGHSYWNMFTISAVASRYKDIGIDIKPYVDQYEQRLSYAREEEDTKAVADKIRYPVMNYIGESLWGIGTKTVLVFAVAPDQYERIKHHASEESSTKAAATDEIRYPTLNYIGENLWGIRTKTALVCAVAAPLIANAWH